MYTNAARQYPEKYGTITLTNFESSAKNKQIQETGAVISIGSMQRPESLRYSHLKIAHLSEVGLWKKTQGKSPQDLIQAVKSSIPLLPLTLVVEESTAKGVGNYFHRAYKRAKNGESGYDLVFVAWFDIERNRIPLSKTSKNRKVNEQAFIKTISPYEWWLWSLGATLEGIKWYRTYKQTELFGDEWAMKSENPSTADEAFQSTGRRVFAPKTILKAREQCIDPVAKGTLFSDAETGKEALKNVTFEESKSGELWIWQYPDNTITVKNRYLVVLDIGGKSKDADWSIFRVIDKYWILEGGVPETVATLKIHIDQDLLAWLGVKLCVFYQNAEFVVENNSLKKEQDTEGDGFLTILNEISEVYDNLYLDQKRDVSRQGVPVKYGFHTNSMTKPLVINTLKAAIRDGGYIERDERTLDECDEFEHKPDGTMGAVDGAHDDFVMSTAIGVHIALKESDKPVLIDEKLISQAKRRAKNKKKIKSEATF